MASIQLDFSKIRIHNGSQDEGFEELVCQLAHLAPPEGATTFIRKDGAGGDAGIECYWTLEDGTEHGWQAKYFDRRMTASQWKQLDKSFISALQKHPKLTKFYVALPFDRTDSRKKSAKGNKVKSFDDKWNETVEKWQKLAAAKNRDIEIKYWGAHEITTYLSTDDPHYTGRALFWFNEPIIGTRQFKDLCQKSKLVLGERYTPEQNVELPIIKDFDGLGSNSEWWDRLKSIHRNIADRHERFVQEFTKTQPPPLSPEPLKALISESETLLSRLKESIKNRNISDRTDNLKNALKRIEEYDASFYDEYLKLDRNATHSSEKSTFRSFFNEWQSLKYFLNTTAYQIALKRSALLYGEAGIGKSHTLCDISEHRNESNLPTVFLLGQHYCGGNPIDLIKTELDLKSHRDGDVLGALDAAGEAARSKTLIIIDAINEGSSRENWKHNIRKFLVEVQQYQNISLLISCRTTYLRYILPDDFDSGLMVRVQHKGFRGFEHRAASIYLSGQGISKPSAPILAPEFSNPLFLKTCCKALKSRGETAFPKGLNGITRLFDFFVTSVEANIAKIKGYNPAEAIVRNTLLSFASELFPNHTEGFPMTQARGIINAFDPDPQRGENLFKILMDEGILAEDIVYSEHSSQPVIRFTYERFSDHFIADQILKGCTGADISQLFEKGGQINALLTENSFLRLQGIYEALAIAIAEHFKLEFIDLLPGEINISRWGLEDLFRNTVLWRSGTSITERTRELLNLCRSSLHEKPAIDILLQLSTEPNHPWNADMLHNSLKKRSMAERDYIWSTYIAISDYEEDEDQPESIVLTLIDWACLGDISETEAERIRLCATALMWFHTTPNRRVRDLTTKAIVRLLANHPAFVPSLIKEFSDINDPYLSERLYAVVLGVFCHIEDGRLQTKIADLVYETLFRGGEPPAHILLRDYARSILELALHRGVLPSSIAPDSFRPPYKSEWPIENPTEAELDELTGDQYRSSIRSSLMGFPGDFGNYTMSCVHDWSPTPLSEQSPKTGYELCYEFAEKHFSEIDKIRFLAISKPTRSRKDYDLQQIDFLEDITKAKLEDLRKLNQEFQKEREEFFTRITQNLSPEDKEYFRWLKGVDTRGAPAFSRKWAQRWVCKRAYRFGWTEKLFKSFEEVCSHRSSTSRATSHMERMGKKYQWIALHELLARLADNLHWIVNDYSEDEDRRYEGPWQLSKRDIDPTIWIRKKASPNSFYDTTPTWWQSFQFNLEKLNDYDAQEKFVWSEDNIPDFPSLFCAKEPGNGCEWLVLNGGWHENQKDDADKHAPRLDASFYIRTIIVRSEDVDAVKAHLIDPKNKREWMNTPEIGNETFYLEYPWHQTCGDSNWRSSKDSFRPLVPVDYLVPTSTFGLESKSRDHSIEESFSIHVPSLELIEGLGLKHKYGLFGSWQDPEGNTVFRDPSVDEKGPSFALVDRTAFESWLQQNNLAVFWLTYGEKQLWNSRNLKFHGKLDYRGTFFLEAGEPVGRVFFKKNLGRDNACQ
ncbi:hypothetical protein [Pelagicoccus sp. SDUM812005]|uniref:hypothetical protein n=1 Tax=Pelagicoccus sp. SDUM812005 TaxID=3041257 RepID=UPI00280D56DB|nr:hypothetical protein [Pelagicoccus sp. SDUM812005]MDQ8180392.1 hypothetical protein [Pelagicoccus sp. SDUM812005]